MYSPSLLFIAKVVKGYKLQSCETNRDERPDPAWMEEAFYEFNWPAADIAPVVFSLLPSQPGCTMVWHYSKYLICGLTLNFKYCLSRGQILGRNPDKSFPPCYHTFWTALQQHKFPHRWHFNIDRMRHSKKRTSCSNLFRWLTLWYNTVDFTYNKQEQL